jgi:hypothetical protein
MHRRWGAAGAARLCAGVASLAPAHGPSTSPLGRRYADVRGPL